MQNDVAKSKAHARGASNLISEDMERDEANKLNMISGTITYITLILPPPPPHLSALRQVQSH